MKTIWNNNYAFLSCTSFSFNSPKNNQSQFDPIHSDIQSRNKHVSCVAIPLLDHLLCSKRTYLSRCYYLRKWMNEVIVHHVVWCWWPTLMHYLLTHPMHESVALNVLKRGGVMVMDHGDHPVQHWSEHSFLQERCRDRHGCKDRQRICFISMQEH